MPVVTPRLIGVDGPVKGEVFVLSASDISIGREPSNSFRIVDPSVSRRHCRIRRLSQGKYSIHDLNSRNGTFLNGLPVGQRPLEHADQVQLGNCHFLFLLHTEEETLAKEFVADPALTQSATLALQSTETICLSLQDLVDKQAWGSRAERSLQALLKTSTAIRSAASMKELAGRLIEVLFETIPAERGAIFLFDKQGDTPAWHLGRSRQHPQDDDRSFDLTTIRRCWREGLAILGSHVPGADLAACSLLAVPLEGSAGKLAVLYMEAHDPRSRFDQEHLQLAAAIGYLSGAALENARHRERLETENRRLREEIHIEHDMVGESPRLREVYRFIAKVAPTDSTVLITGESGTGKELVARAIHRNSKRSGGPFVALNCAALTETLLESELFGHEKGAFTGAIAQKKGKLEVADSGTVFLDEIGDLPGPLQAKLLRVLQEREFERVGGMATIKIDLRIIAATNQDLQRAVSEGRFREDLFYRLNVVALRMPALRERRADIPLLASYFAQRYGNQFKRRISGVSPEARALLADYDWPGNVRELENSIERAVVLGSAEEILPEDLPETLLETASESAIPAGTYHEMIREEKRRRILQAIQEAAGSHVEAAKRLGIHPTYLSRLIRNLNLRTSIRKSAGSD